MGGLIKPLRSMMAAGVSPPQEPTSGEPAGGGRPTPSPRSAVVLARRWKETALGGKAPVWLSAHCFLVLLFLNKFCPQRRGSNSQSGDQELNPLPTEPTGHPAHCFLSGPIPLCLNFSCPRC